MPVAFLFGGLALEHLYVVACPNAANRDAR
jgi:hypothetical protein